MIRPLVISSLLLALILLTTSQSSQTSSIQSTSSSGFSPISSGNYRMNFVAGYDPAGYNTNISVVISDRTITFRYCNQNSYNYRTTGSRITITGGWDPVINCKMASGPSEYQIQNALQSAYSWVLSGSTLIIKNNVGKTVASFVKQSNSKLSHTSTTSSSIIGTWTAGNVKGKTVSFAVTITPSNLSYRYCNSKSMGVTTKGNKITLSPGISTLMACIGLNPTQEFVSSAFNSVRSYKVSSNKLLFLDKNGHTVITLKRGSAPITGTYTISMINNVGTVELNKVQVTITKNQISFKYCNGKTFPYTVNGNSISIKAGISTQMFCDGLNPSENDVTKAFTDAKTFKMDGDTLTLYGADGRTKVVLGKSK